MTCSLMGLDCMLADGSRLRARVLSDGRLLSRFSRDLDALDSALPAMLAQAFTCVAALLAALVAILAASPFAAPAVMVLAIIFGRLVARYRPTAAEAKRLVSVLHGPVVSHLLEVIRLIAAGGYRLLLMAVDSC
jgi:ABC-type transport system involved in cytochrome bd biosynthesis fused ATPase/permease subunit